MGTTPRIGVRTLSMALLPGLLGIALLYWPPAEFLERNGLDLLFALRGARPEPKGVAVIAIDDASYAELGIPPGPIPRAVHAQLIRALTAAGAKAVAFDVLFDTPADPGQDLALEEALTDTGIVVLGATVERVDDPQFVEMRRVDPYPFLAEAAAAVGQVGLPLERDGVIRSAWLLHEDRPSLALAAYEVATGDRTKRDPRIRFIDFYGPPRTVRTFSLYQGLDPGQYLPPRFLEGRMVFVGLSQPAAGGPAAKDAFPTPFREAEGGQTYGVEIHATLAANLVDGHRIQPLPRAWEALFLLLLPLAATFLFLRIGPLPGSVALLACMVVPWAVAIPAFTSGGYWLPVIVPSLVQLPTAYVASVVWYYLTTVRERERIRRAFSFYLSPAMIGKITKDPGNLNLGGEEIVGTALMTDIAGFTTIAETLGPVQTAAMLNSYFSGVTQHVFDTGGTLIKFIGDAVFAIWNAPVRQDDHATLACTAALALARAQDGPPADGRQLVTRIGVHTGPMVVGNLGSSQRFDYTAIGDAVNVAARLEGLNKKLGTLAIVSDTTLRATGGRFRARSLGSVRVVGRNEAIEIHEIVGEAQGEPRIPEQALTAFESALRCYVAGKLTEAAAGFRECRDLCGGKDGPSEFYLRLVERFAAAPLPEGWDGVVTFESK